MRETVFEGVGVKVPYAYGEILVEEYGGAALVKRAFADHRWDEGLREWVPDMTAEGILGRLKGEDVDHGNG